MTISPRFRIIAMLAMTTLFTAGLAATAQDPAKPAPRPVEDEDAEQLGQQTFTENCLICHGEEMAANQRLTTKQWTATIDKMVGWGSPVPAEKKAPLLTYLTAHFSENATAAKSDVSTAKELLASRAATPVKPLSADLTAGEALFIKHCATCHGPRAQGGDLGTNLIEKAILVDEKAYHETVRKGVRRMPSFATVLDATAETNLLAWLRSRHAQ